MGGPEAPPNRGIVPLPPSGPGPGNQFGPPLMGRLVQPQSGVPSRPNVPQMSRMPSISPLVAGATLQNRRYRVLGPYRPAQTPDGRPLLGLPQWVAVDSGMRGDRVSLLEIPLSPEMPPAVANRAREALVSQMLAIEHHANMQTILGAFGENGRHFLVLQHIEGTFLTDRVLRYGNVNERLVLTYADELLAALALLERQTPKTLHGAISPDAVILSSDGSHARLLVPSPILIAQALNIPCNAASLHVPGYVPPEQLQNQGDDRSDLYSLGATLYFATTGYDAAARTATIFVAPRQINSAISAPVDAVLAKSVRQVPSQRYQHAEDMQLDIQRAMNGEMPNRDAVNRLEPILPRNVSRTNTLVFTSIISVLIAAILVILLLVRGSASSIATESVLPTATIDATAAALASKGIGLSSGKLIFDQQPLKAVPGNVATPAPNDGTPAGAILAEQAGALALQKNDFGTAISAFKQAVQDDPSNAEALIYLLDAQIDAQRANRALAHQPPLPFITLDVAASFSDKDLSYSREVLRGAALEQYRVDQQHLLPGGVQLRIEIASIGDNISGAPELANYYAAELASKNLSHSIGVLSWSVHNITPDEAQILAQAFASLSGNGVPVLVPVSTTDRFPPKPDPNFFQLSSTDQYQGGVIATTALSPPFSATRVVIVQDQASIPDLEIAGTANVLLGQKLGATNVILETLGKGATIDSVVRDVQTSGANAIIFAGGSDEAVTLATKVAATGRPVPIITSYTADSPSLIGQSFDASTAATAQKAVANPQAMRLLHVVGLADESQWNSAINPQAQKAGVPNFFNAFTSQFSPLNQGLPLTPTANAIFAYDAVGLMMWALANNTLRPLSATTLPNPPDLAVALRTIIENHPFQGISGRIAFDSRGIPMNRSLVLKTIAPSGSNDARGNPLLSWKIEATIGQFCSSDTCKPNF